MKSDESTLRNRGMAVESDVAGLYGFSQAEVMAMLHSGLSHERTAAVRLISLNYGLDREITRALLERLSIEKSLYTKIEICNALQKGDAGTAELMTGYLGRIGSNQHKKLPVAVSKKTSYPLPRDVIARTLAKMDVSVFPVLLDVMAGDDERKISEAVDAIGSMAFYHGELADSRHRRMVLEAMRRHEKHAVIYWKCVICLSAFPSRESIAVLDAIIAGNENAFLRSEAARSKSILLKNKRIEGQTKCLQKNKKSHKQDVHAISWESR